MNDQASHHPDREDPEPQSLPSVEQIVERLERLWRPEALDSISGDSVHGLGFGRYMLQEVRGQGAFGIVYRAVDTQLDRDVAVKVPRIQVLADNEKRRRFEDEASAAAMLDHPGIVTIYEADLAGPTPYIASAYCAGPDLGEWLARYGSPVPWPDAANLVAQLAEAVDYAHQRGVYHRDLKPSNILLVPLRSDSGYAPTLGGFQPKITDFGLAKLAQAAVADTRSSVLIGTPLYMAPEQAESSRTAPPAAADIYSLGCILYELVSGRPPIEGDSYLEVIDRLRDQSPIPLRRRQSGTPRDLEVVCAKCLEKDPNARYESAGQLAADLRACAAGSPISAREASLLSRIKYWCTRPQRIRDAGWYALCVQLLLTLWTGITLVGAQQFDAYTSAEKGRLYFEFIVLMASVNVPMIVAGWYTTRHHRWAIYAGLILTLVNLVLPVVFVAVTDRLFFAAIYEKIDSSDYYAFSSGTLVLLAELGQLVLYTTAIAAWRNLPQNRKVV